METFTGVVRNHATIADESQRTRRGHEGFRESFVLYDITRAGAEQSERLVLVDGNNRAVRTVANDGVSRCRYSSQQLRLKPVPYFKPIIEPQQQQGTLTTRPAGYDHASGAGRRTFVSTAQIVDD